MTILNGKNTGSFNVQSDVKYATTDFGTTIEPEVDDVTKPEVDVNDVTDGDEKDVLVSIIGEFGKFQFISVLLIGLTGFTYPWVNFANKFLTYEVEFWCSKVQTCFLDIRIK
jgi:hypothetical protein